PEVKALRRAATLYRRGRQSDARAIFARYDSLQAQVGAAFAQWPDGTLAELAGLEQEHPRSGFVRLHLGLALLWSRQDAQALAQCNPARAFSHLGPPVRTFPRAATVRFHLGLMLLWLGRVDEAKRQLALARADAPRSVLGREVQSFLLRLKGIGTK